MGSIGLTIFVFSVLIFLVNFDTASALPLIQEVPPAQDQIKSRVGGAIDSEGNFIFAEDSEIVKLRSDGTEIFRIGSVGAGQGQFQFITYIAVDSSDRIYVGDFTSNITIFSSDGIFLKKFSSIAGSVSGFNSIDGITIDSNGFIFVSDGGAGFSQNPGLKIFSPFTGSNTPSFVLEFGSFGTGDGQLGTSQGISFDTQDRLYVVDLLGNHRVQIFDTFDGILPPQFLQKFGEFGRVDSGSGCNTNAPGAVDPCDGQFWQPLDVDVDDTGRIAVADFDNERVQVFAPFDGINPPLFLTKFGTEGKADGQFFNLRIVVFDDVAIPTIIFTVDSTTQKIQKFDLNGNLLEVSSLPEPGNGKLRCVGDMAYDSLGNQYLLCDDIVQKFDSNGNFLLQFGSTGTAPGQLSGGLGIAIDSNDNIFIAEAFVPRISIFDSSGSFVMSFGTPGTGPGELSFPRTIDIDKNDRIFVGDFTTAELHIFGAFNEVNPPAFIQDFDGLGTGGIAFGGIGGVAFDSLNNFYVVDTFPSNIQKFDENTNHILTINERVFDLSFDSADRMYGTDYIDANVSIYDSSGNIITSFDSLGSNPCQLFFALKLYVDDQDNIHVTGGSKVQKFGPFDPFSSASIVLDSTDFELDHAGSFTVTDLSADITGGQDVLCAQITSDSDPIGVATSLLETSTPGEFALLNLIQFTSGVTNSATNALSVAIGDTVTAEYQTIIDTASIITADNTPIGVDPINVSDVFNCQFSGGDTDGDGLCDNWEQGSAGLVIDDPILTAPPPFGLGLTINDPITIPCQQPLCPSNAIKDIYVELDFMEGHQPDPQAIADVVDAFATAPTPINLHVIVDDEILHTDVIFFDTMGENSLLSDFDILKLDWFGTDDERADVDNFADIREVKRQFMRYTLFVHDVDSQTVDPGVSGIAEQHGNDVIVSLGSFTNGVGSVNQQAGTFMHELGHTLNLNHGGPNVELDENNCKPNYLSVMNYAYQLPDFLPERPIDYSRVIAPLLNENMGLNEATGFDSDSSEWPRIAYGTPNGVHRDLADGTAIDWNDNDVIESGLTADINNFGIADCDGTDGGPSQYVDLQSYDDWSVIEVDFKTTSNFNDGLHVLSLAVSPEIAIENVIEIREDAVEQQNQQIQGLDDEAFAPGVDPVQAKQDLADSLDELSTLSTSTDSNDLESAAQLAAEIQQTITDTIDDPTIQQELLDQLGDLAATTEDSADAGESIHATPDTLYAQKADTITQLSALIETSDSKTIKKIEKATQRIQNSLNTDYWNPDANTLTQDLGKKVFKEEKKAVKKLMKIKNPVTEIQTVIDTLVLVDQTLAQTAIDDAISNPDANQNQIDKAQNEMNKAQDDLDDEKFDKAIKHYQKAWKHAQKAINPNMNMDDDEDDDD